MTLAWSRRQRKSRHQRSATALRRRPRQTTCPSAARAGPAGPTKVPDFSMIREFTDYHTRARTGLPEEACPW